MMPPESKAADFQSRLAWAYSLYAGIFAFLFSILIFSPVSGAPFAAIAGVSAVICARIAGWIASRFGRSGYGLVASVITAIFVALMPSGVAIIYVAIDNFQSGYQPTTAISEFAVLLGLTFIIGLKFALSAALVATLIFQLALVVVRKQQWLAFQQRWI